MICPQCKTPNRDGEVACAQCGAILLPAVLPQTAGQLCRNCNRPNRVGAKFCNYCREPLTSIRRCPHCAAENRVQARHCQQCGKALMTNAPPRLGTGSLPPKLTVNQRYLIVKKIAQGGMGAVYLVLDTHLTDPMLNRAKPLALKEMSQSAFQPDQLAQAIAMFKREAAMLAHLKHPNLPQVTDSFEFQSKYFLVMEYIEGETLDASLAASATPFPLPTVLRWARQLIGVLQYLHDQTPPIIYRDLKPGNIMEEKNGTLKLIDFGIARFKRTSKSLAGAPQPDAQLGTAGYAAPEQWKQGEVGPAADVYALGVTLHQLLTKHEPAKTPFNLPLASTLNRAVPEPIARALARAHDPNITRRVQTIREFERVLEQAVRDAH